VADSTVIQKIGIDELIPKMKIGSFDHFRNVALPKAVAIAGLRR
jgi:hypothetical protein